MELGYACINLTLADQKITCNRGMIKKTFTEKGIQYASQLALQNVQDLYTVVKWNVKHKIALFRVSSDLFPWASEYKIESLPDFREIRSTMELIGKLPVRLTTHPGPFNKLAGSGDTLNNTIIDLETHSQVFDLMNIPPSHYNKINIHVGGAYGDKEETLKRFAANFSLLSENLQQRLTVENDDKQGLFTVADLYNIYEEIGTPIVFDYFHHQLHPGLQTEQEAFFTAYSTWKMQPVFHFSSSRRLYEEPLSKKEAHSDWVHDEINTYGMNVAIMLETKMKDLALLKYRKAHKRKSLLTEAPLA
ncbi:MAG TPA: UV DNA damage repair endonuclease UvsE [Flavisolibacter sp.]|nr:UV DNA damage repair endonuclease UvsE [Flavisolibacter sp.]